MKKFNWKKDAPYGRSGPVFYYSDEKQYDLNYKKTFIDCMIEINNDGSNSGFAIVCFTVKWPDPSEHFGTKIIFHESGKGITQKLKKICNFFLNHPPTSFCRIGNEKEEIYKVNDKDR